MSIDADTFQCDRCLDHFSTRRQLNILGGVPFCNDCYAEFVKEWDEWSETIEAAEHDYWMTTKG